MPKPAAKVNPAVDRYPLVSFRLPVIYKKRLQSKCIMDGTSWSEMGRALAMAYLQGRRIEIDGVTLKGHLQRERGAPGK